MSNLRIDRIIEIKEKLKEEKERELEEANTCLSSVLHNISIVETEIDVTYNTLSSKCMEGNEFSVIKDYLTYLGDRKASLRYEAEEVKIRIGLLQSAFFEMAKEVKMFEKLRSKTCTVIKKLENRKEQKKLDDIALRCDDKGLRT
jgi:flagellar export protein FliJ